jgi:hypothetical protein
VSCDRGEHSAPGIESPARSHRRGLTIIMLAVAITRTGRFVVFVTVNAASVCPLLSVFNVSLAFVHIVNVLGIV